MKQIINVFLLLVLGVASLQAEERKGNIRLVVDLPNGNYLFIDDTDFYMIELKTDTFCHIEGNLFFSNNKDLQINSVGFNNGRSTGVFGDPHAEQGALAWYKKWELDYQKKTFGKKLKSKEEHFVNQSGKPFLIWWYEQPKASKKAKMVGRSIEVPIDLKMVDEVISLNSTHQLYLNFIIHGNKCVAISTSVLENGSLEDEIEKMKEIANSLNVYADRLSPKVLFDRIEDPNYVFKDSEGLVEIELPAWLNVLYGTKENVFSASFPEKDNVLNAVVISWFPKTEFDTFSDFSQKLLQGKPYDEGSLELLSQKSNEERYYFTINDGWHRGYTIYGETDNVYYYINFIATETTYDYNIVRLHELVSKVKFK